MKITKKSHGSVRQKFAASVPVCENCMASHGRPCLQDPILFFYTAPHKDQIRASMIRVEYILQCRRLPKTLTKDVRSLILEGSSDLTAIGENL